MNRLTEDRMGYVVMLDTRCLMRLIGFVCSAFSAYPAVNEKTNPMCSLTAGHAEFAKKRISTFLAFPRDLYGQQKQKKLLKSAQKMSKTIKNSRKPSKTMQIGARIRISYLVSRIRLRSGQAKNISTWNCRVHSCESVVRFE